MRLRFILPLLWAVAWASSPAAADCQCPQVKCHSDDPVALCYCLNYREAKCQLTCPGYKPTYHPCPLPAPVSTRILEPIPSLVSTPKPVSKPLTCQCPLVNCLEGPGLCACIKTAAENCYERCGGEPPRITTCKDNLESPSPSAEPTCECEGVFCIQSWPESCYCANAAAKACHNKCGGQIPDLQICPPQTPSSIITSIRASVSLANPKGTALPPNVHKICGGGRANAFQCDQSYTCITDPYTPGCGPACDGIGICVKDEICGGFAGFACADKSQVCHDDPRDDCDPTRGGADCAGLCVTPHRSLRADI